MLTGTTCRVVGREPWISQAFCSSPPPSSSPRPRRGRASPPSWRGFWGAGPRDAVAFSIGVALGDVVWLTFAILGLAALAQAFHGVFLVIKYAGAAYLLYIAYKLWTAPAAAAGREADGASRASGQALPRRARLTMGNPKVMVFYLALLPTLLDLTRITVLGFAELVAATLTVLGVVFAGYIVLAARARRLFTSARAIRILNRTTGAVHGGRRGRRSRAR